MNKRLEVHIRGKPRVEEEDIWMASNNSLSYIKGGKKTTYSCFNSIFLEKDTSLFYTSVISKTIKKFLHNENTTIFAYGQTGSGKTYTMFGENRDGIVYRSLKEIVPMDVTISCMEIYNEKVFDLSTKNEVSVYNVNKDLVITGLHYERVYNFDQATDFLYKCNLNKTVDSTEFNLKSSRSHIIIQVKKPKCILNFIDLAGSEKASNNSLRRAEGAYINKSLLALSTLINNFHTNRRSGFRDSKLTRILETSLNSETNLIAICMIAQSVSCIDESISTLKFAARLANLEFKGLETKPTETELISRQKNNNKKENNNSLMKTNYQNSLSSFIKSGDNSVDNLDEEVGKTIFDINFNFKDELRSQTKLDQLYRSRIDSLEGFIKLILEEFPNKKLQEIFILEKHMFNLKFAIIKGTKNTINEFNYG